MARWRQKKGTHIPYFFQKPGIQTKHIGITQDPPDQNTHFFSVPSFFCFRTKQILPLCNVKMDNRLTVFSPWLIAAPSVCFLSLNDVDTATLTRSCLRSLVSLFVQRLNGQRFADCEGGAFCCSKHIKSNFYPDGKLQVGISRVHHLLAVSFIVGYFPKRSLFCCCCLTASSVGMVGHFLTFL